MKPRALLVFGREPVAGRVKTRLSVDTGAEAACSIYRELLQNTLAMAAKVAADLFLYLPPGDKSENIDQARACLVKAQQGPDLGSRMHQAFQDQFACGYQQVVLIGSDCPYLSSELVEEAFSALEKKEAVFGPAADGGYYLVGQCEFSRELFYGIRWSTPQVWSATKEILHRDQISYASLPVLEDIDDQESYRRYQNFIAGSLQ